MAMNEIEDSSFLSRPSSTVGSERSSRLSAQFNLSNASSTNQLQQQNQINQNPFGSRNGNRSTSGSLSLTESTPGTDSSLHSPTSNAPSNGNLEDRNSDPNIAAAIERKRQEHERHRALQRQAFEQEMALLEKKQREEEERLRSSAGQDPISNSNQINNRHHSNPSRSQLLAVSAPTTPPEPKLAIQRPGNSSSSPILGTLENPLHSDTQDGLNGSNVPGLRSLPTSRRASRDAKDPAYGDYTAVLAAAGGGASSVQPSQPQRRPIGADLSASFERLDLVPRGVSQLRAQSQDNSLSSISSRGSGNSSSGQASPLHRSISRSGSDQQGNGSSNETGLTPVLSERFLFDDELDAEDSAFIKRYNLQDKTDDKFPVLIRRDSFPGMNDARLGSESNLSKEQSQRSHYQAPGASVNDLPVPPHSASATAFRGAEDRRSNPDGLRSTDDAGFPSFAMNAFNNNGLASPNRFAPYSPSAFDGGNNSSRSRPNSGYFDAFGASQSFGSGGTGSGFGLGSTSDPSGLTEPTTPAGIKSASLRKGELDVATRLEELQGEIFPLCKDQHGCRYLQKKLEENTPHYRDMIFAETFDHFSELMTDPFGNYLCQKMLEFCTDEQRNHIVDSVRNDLVTISLNMHGTRAVQKTIDFLSTPRQIQSIIFALGTSVVTLIKDLNGNHVIQKCLNRLGAEDNQFIYNAVAQHCVEVATHRHGCCVLQRCIDHASESQRMQLVAEITFNALALVQDPFGNYVVQYVLDLNDARYSDGVIRQFIGNVCLLSVQKFSSNVIEKCIRVSEPGTRKSLIDELLNRTRLEKLLRDSFANYVVQTSLDYAEPLQRMQLVECIRPILPVIRNTPYGKRIQSKLQRDNLDLGPPPNLNMSYSLLQAAHQQQLQAMAAMAARGGPADFGAAGMGMGMGMGGNMGLNPYQSGLLSQQSGGGMMGGPPGGFPPMHHQQQQQQLPPSQRMNPNQPMYNTAQQQQQQQFGGGPPQRGIASHRGGYHGQSQGYGGQAYGVNGFSAGMPSPMLQGGGYGGRY